MAEFKWFLAKSFQRSRSPFKLLRREIALVCNTPDVQFPYAENYGAGN